MKLLSKEFGLVASALVMGLTSYSTGAFAQDAYSGCTCISAPISYSGGVGQIVLSNGDVLVNNAGASSGQILASSSEIIVGDGSASYNIGAGCSNAVGANTIVTISQPAGPGSDLCVRVSSIDPVSPALQGGGVNPIAGLITIGVGAVGAAITPFGSAAKGRPPASN